MEPSGGGRTGILFYAGVNNRSGIVAISIYDEELYQSQMLLLPYWSRVLLVVVALATFLTGTWFKSYSYNHLWKELKSKGLRYCLKDRPINILILQNLMVQHANCFNQLIILVHLLIFESSIGDTLGNLSCEIFFILSFFALTHLVVGYLVLTMYRVMYVWFNETVKARIGEQRLLLLSLVCGNLVASLLTTSFHWTMSSGNYHFIRECYVGAKRIEAEAILKFSDPSNLHYSNWMKQKTMFVLVFFIVLDVLISLKMFYHIWKHDSSTAVRLLTQKAFKERRQKNMMSFSGQLISFIVSFCFITIAPLILWIGRDSRNYTLLAQFIRLYIFFEFATLSVIDVVFSPILYSQFKSSLSAFTMHLGS